MRNKKLRLGLTGLLIFFFIDMKGQDPQFSQFFNCPIYYNPATAGMSEDLRILSTYRNLWSKIPGDLSTSFVSVDYLWPGTNNGLGLLVLNNNEGLHRIRTSRIELIYAYRVIREEDVMLQLGMSVFSINLRDFHNRDLIFSDQLDPIGGVVRQSAFVNDEVEPVIYPDWNAGMVYRQNFNWRHHRITPTIGFSASHILRPNISFVNNVVRLPVKYVVNANLLTPVIFNNFKVPSESKIAYLNPGFVYEYQKPFQTFTLGAGFNVEPLRFGIWFRNRNFFSDDVYKINSLIIHLGCVTSIFSDHNLIIDYTYDSTTSKLEFTSGGAHEITLVYNIPLPEKKGAVICHFNKWWD